MPSPLEVGTAHLKGAHLHNISPRQITTETLREESDEGGHSLSLNVGALSSAVDLAKGLISSDPARAQQRQLIDSYQGIDPRQKKGFVDLGSWEWDTQSVRNDYQSTASGSAAREGIESDPAKARINFQTERSSGGIPLMVPDLTALRQQAALLGGESLQALQQRESAPLVRKTCKEIEEREADPNSEDTLQKKQLASSLKADATKPQEAEPEAEASSSDVRNVNAEQGATRVIPASGGSLEIEKLQRAAPVT